MVMPWKEMIHSDGCVFFSPSHKEVWVGGQMTEYGKYLFCYKLGEGGKNVVAGTCLA